MMSVASSERFGIRGRGRFCLPGLRASCLLGLCLITLSGCELRGRPTIGDKPVPSDQVLDFAQLFRQNCTGCHGADGQMGPAPPLHDDLFRALIPEKELLNVVLSGRKGTLMPAFAIENGGTLTRAQVQVLVNEIAGQPYKIVEKTPGQLATAEVVAGAGGKPLAWGKPPAPPRGTPDYLQAAGNGSSAANIQKGAALFARACAECPGENGKGMEHGDKRINAINDPVFLALNSDQILRRMIITGRKDLGMPDFDGGRSAPEFEPLTGQDVSDLVALLASWRHPPVAPTKP
jgi:cytochrome c oxidase cbb3-type subunit III